MTSEHELHGGVDLARRLDEGVARVAMLEAAITAAVRLLQTSVNTRAGRGDGGPVELLTALLAIPAERPGSWEAPHVEALDDALRAILAALVR